MVNSPLPLSYNPNVPSTLFCLKYFCRLSSSFVLFTEHVKKLTDIIAQQIILSIRKIYAKLASNPEDKRHVQVSAFGWPYARTRIKRRPLGEILLVGDITEIDPHVKILHQFE